MATKFFGSLKAGATSVSIDFLLLKTADNTPDTGKVATNLTAYYYRLGASTTTSITLSDLSSLSSSYSSGGMKEIGDGSYRLDVPDAMQATGSGVDWVELTVKDSTTSLYKERFALEANGADDVYGIVNTTGAKLAATQAFNNTGQTNNLPANVTQILGTASAGAAGYVGIDWAHVNAPTTSLGLSGTTISTSQAVASVAGGVTVADKTGFSLAVTPPTAVQVRQEMDANSTKLANLDATVSSRSTFSGGSVTLAANGLDAIPIADPGGVSGQTTFPKILVALYRRFFKMSTLTATQLKTYGDNGTTVNTTQTVADDGTTQTQGAST